MSSVLQGDSAADLSAGRRIIIENAYLAPVVGAEIESGHLIVTDGRISGLGSGPAPATERAERIDATGCLVTPGLVNTHHHLYQWATQGLYQDATLFEWLTGLYRTWARIDADITYGAAAAGLAWLALSGTSTSTDHHYVFPSGRGDLFEAEVRAAAEVGLRFHPCRGSMDRGRADGGLPPDEVVETTDRILADTAAAIDRYHDPSFDSMLRVAVAPCSPFSVSETLMRESANLARDKGVRLHTHLAETLDEEQHCRDQLGCTPVEYMEKIGWLGPDVWFAHAVHLHDKDIRRFADTGSGTAHCPSSNARLGAGIARVRDLLDAGATVGLGVDGAASSELTSLAGEMRQAMLFQRALHGPDALTARKALEIGTLGGARNLGRQSEIGSLEPGKLADIAIWRVDGFRSAIGDPVCTLVFGPTPPLARLLVGGRTVVENGELRTADQDVIAAAGANARKQLVREDNR